MVLSRQNGCPGLPHLILLAFFLDLPNLAPNVEEWQSQKQCPGTSLILTLAFQNLLPGPSKSSRPSLPSLATTF